MKKHEVHTLSNVNIFANKKEKLKVDVEKFLNNKVTEGYEIVSVSFTDYENTELVAFITICK